MNLLIANGGERGDHHIEAIKPAPVLNVVKAHRARGGEQQQGDNDDLEQAKALQVQAELLIASILDQTANLTTEARRARRKLAGAHEG